MKKRAKRAQRPKVILAARGVLQRSRDKKILLLKRSRRDGWAAGRWELPGGKFEPGQSLLRILKGEMMELLKRVLKRELDEETSLKVSRRWIIPLRRYERADRVGRSAGSRYSETVFQCTRFSGKVKLSKEHESYRWVTVEEALGGRLRLTTDARKALEFMLE